MSQTTLTDFADDGGATRGSNPTDPENERTPENDPTDRETTDLEWGGTVGTTTTSEAVDDAVDRLRNLPVERLKED
jgi:hypothetical protein